MNEHQIARSDVWFIGDSETDMAAGKKAGVHTILIRHPNKKIKRKDDETAGDYEFDSLGEAVDFIAAFAFKNNKISHT